jgi:two-component system chemotaxis sensor kinase CheA
MKNERRYGGLGLELYLSCQWLHRLGGYIDVESVIGHGSRLRVWLPHRGLLGATAIEQTENREANVPSGLLSTGLQLQIVNAYQF